jgi:hypothetical protein
MHDFGGVLWECHAALRVLLRDYCDDEFELGQGRVARLAARDMGRRARRRNWRRRRSEPITALVRTADCGPSPD